jgi:hypothetical protein
VTSSENSQHIADWYTPTHLTHGIIFYLLVWLMLPKAPILVRFALALGIEASWEIFENTPFVIEHYRQQALAQGYVGDSVINSIFDSVAAAAGFLLASRLPALVTILLVLAIELVLLAAIRDNLTLNILQLVYPSEIIAKWQAGG